MDMTMYFTHDSFFLWSWVFPGSTFPDGLFWVDTAGHKDLEGEVNKDKAWRTCSREKQMIDMKELLVVLLGVITAVWLSFR